MGGHRYTTNKLLTPLTTQSRTSCIIKAAREKGKSGICSMEEIAAIWTIPQYDYKTLLNINQPVQQKQDGSVNKKFKHLQVTKLKVSAQEGRWRCSPALLKITNNHKFIL